MIKAAEMQPLFVEYIPNNNIKILNNLYVVIM
jgi:hypothetical protein